ncbi:MAG: FAD-dependent oxidoreductase [Acidimicrobiales bacterium]|nr:FAD-dependent oxidoreductase [Acidimicrobiales bacterium]
MNPAPASTASADVVVIGAGPAGLAAAWRASVRGLSVIVLERSAQVGGMAASLMVGGQRVDLGSHRLHPATPAPILDAITRLLGADLQRRRRNGRIVLRSRFVRFPLSTVDLLANLPRDMVAGLAIDTLTAPLRKPRADTYAEVIRAGLGPVMLREFYGPYARKLWGLGPDELAGELARRRVAARSPAKIAQRLLMARREPPWFFYPRRGFGQITEAFADAAARAGAQIRFGASGTVTSIDAGTVKALDGSCVEAGVVLSTIPIGVLARLVSPAFRTRLDYRGMVLVYLVIDCPRYTEFDAHYVPDPGTIISRLSEPKNYREGPDPPDRTVLCAEVPCIVGDALWNQQDQALAERVVDELASVGLPLVGQRLSGYHVVRLPTVYPVYRRGFENELAAAEAALASEPRVLSFGRAGLFTPDNTHHALAMAWAAVDSIGPDGEIDRARWAVARLAFCDHVVED